MTKTVELNTKLTAVRDFISDTVEARGYPPTMREISTHFGIKSTSSVSYYLKKLEDAGELQINSRLSRGIKLKDKNVPASHLQSVPLVGGDIFMLTVEGSSMIEAGINDGDKILVKKQTHAEDGQIVVALVDDECATVKRLKIRNGEVYLHPENRAMSDLHPENLQILGIVVGLIRTQIS